MKENKVQFKIKHPYNGWSHYGPRSSTKCCGMAVTLSEDGDVLVFNGLHSKGMGESVGVVIDANCIDKLIIELTAMREDIIVANL